MESARFVVSLQRSSRLDHPLQRFGSSNPSSRLTSRLRSRVLAQDDQLQLRDELLLAASSQSQSQQQQKMGLTDTEMESTTEQRLWVFAGCTAVGATLAKAAAAVAAVPLALPLALGGTLCGYILADLASGVYHWGIDNYGDANTPVFGAQIDAFQGHHQRPSTITRRQFANNISAIAKPAAFALAPLLLLAPPNAAVDSFVGVSVGCIVMSQQFHAWAHTRKSDLPQAVVVLQAAGLLVGRNMHTRHHRAPYSCDYCIVSGLCNGFLDSKKVFRRVENWIYDIWGIAPRCWLEVNSPWAQQQDDLFN